MPPQWTLTVEGLGRIQRAEVRTHPLMLFVGGEQQRQELSGVAFVGADDAGAAQTISCT